MLLLLSCIGKKDCTFFVARQQADIADPRLAALDRALMGHVETAPQPVSLLMQETISCISLFLTENWVYNCKAFSRGKKQISLIHDLQHWIVR
jgi:hypothetical protein